MRIICRRICGLSVRNVSDASVLGVLVVWVLFIYIMRIVLQKATDDQPTVDRCASRRLFVVQTFTRVIERRSVGDMAPGRRSI
jgi:hypothetical protein